MLDFTPLFAIIRAGIWCIATMLGSFGIFALVCSLIKPGTDAAMMGTITFLLASCLTLAAPVKHD